MAVISETHGQFEASLESFRASNRNSGCTGRTIAPGPYHGGRRTLLIVPGLASSIRRSFSPGACATSPTALNNAELQAWCAMEAEPYYYRGLWDEAVLAAEEALPVAWEISEWGVVFFSSAWLAIAYLKLGQPDKARRVLDRLFNEAPARIYKLQANAIPYAQIARAQIHLTTGQLQRGPEYRSPGACRRRARCLPSRRSRGPSRSRASPRSDGRSGRGRRRIPPQP